MELPPPPPTSTDHLLELQGAQFHDPATLSAVTIAIKPGSRTLLLGRNGSGSASASHALLFVYSHYIPLPQIDSRQHCTAFAESTLLAGLAGKLPLSAGTRVVGERWLQVLHWDSSQRDACDAEDETPLEFVMRLASGSADESQVLALLDGIGVDQFAARRPIGCLSSGERTMTALTALCIAPKHLLLLDEPHAFLGAAAVRVLAEALSPERWPGTLVCACSSRAAAEALRPTQVAMLLDGRVVLKERPPCEEDWAALE